MRRRADGHKPRWGRRTTDGAYRKHPNAKLYHERQVRWSEEMWVTECETDYLTALEAGIESVIATFGAKVIPKDLGVILSRKGVKRLKLLFHNDKEGADWANRIFSLLEGFDINVRPLSLAAHVGQQGDLNDMWVDCGFDVARLLQQIEELPPLTLPRLKKQPPRPAYVHNTREDFAELRCACEACLPITGWQRSGWSKNFRPTVLSNTRGSGPVVCRGQTIENLRMVPDTVFNHSDVQNRGHSVYSDSPQNSIYSSVIAAVIALS